MTTLVYSHPRSRSSLLMEGFDVNLGEALDLSHRHPVTFEQIWGSNQSISTHLADRYLYKIANSEFGDIDKAAIKIFAHHFMSWPRGKMFLKGLKPKTVMVISRADKLATMKSWLIAFRRGFTSFDEKTIESFAVSIEQFNFIYKHLFQHYEEGLKWIRDEFSVDYELEYNDLPSAFPKLKELGLIDRVPVPQLKEQHSSSLNHLILNEMEVEQWFAKKQNT